MFVGTFIIGALTGAVVVAGGRIISNLVDDNRAQAKEIKDLKAENKNLKYSGTYAAYDKRND